MLDLLANPRFWAYSTAVVVAAICAWQNYTYKNKRNHIHIQYPYPNTDNIVGYRNNDQFCDICNRMLTSPIILVRPCRHRFDDCFHHIRESQMRCPICRREISSWEVVNQ